MKTYKKQKGGEPGFSLVKIMIIVSVLGLIIYSGNNLLNKPKNNQGGGGPTGDTLPVDSSTGDTLPVEEDKSCPNSAPVAQNERYCSEMHGICLGPRNPVSQAGVIQAWPTAKGKYKQGVSSREECQNYCDTAGDDCTGYTYLDAENSDQFNNTCWVHGDPEAGLKTILPATDSWEPTNEGDSDIIRGSSIGPSSPAYIAPNSICVAVARSTE